MAPGLLKTFSEFVIRYRGTPFKFFNDGRLPSRFTGLSDLTLPDSAKQVRSRSARSRCGFLSQDKELWLPELRVRARVEPRAVSWLVAMQAQ